MEPLADGSYEALVLDVSAAECGGALYDLTLLRGPQKGVVVTVTSTLGDPDDLSPLGIGATLVVQDGRPSIVLDRPLGSRPTPRESGAPG